MQVQNPMFKFYKKLAGSWKNADGSCTAVLSEFSNIELSYGGGALNESYSVYETGPATIVNTYNTMGMMAASLQRHDGEELRVQIGDNGLRANGLRVYNVDCIWYSDDDKIHMELTDIQDGHKETVILSREEVNNAVPEGSFRCECGYTGPVSRFCPECGRAVNN